MPDPNPRHTKRFGVIALAVTLLLAGVVSLYASSSPDGLEKVAGDTGFIGTAKGHASDGSPLAGYEASFVGGPLGQTIAGIVGVLVTLALFYALVRFLRRREPQQADQQPVADRPAGQSAEQPADRPLA